MMRHAILALTLLLSACSLFQPEKGSWTKSGSNDDTVFSDLQSCKQQARAMIETDDQIDQDIATQGTDFGSSSASPDLEANLDNYRYGNRYDEIVRDCMTARGYAREAEAS